MQMLKLPIQQAMTANKMKNSTLYDLMRKSELMDDDGMDLDDAESRDERTDAERFKEQYKEFYTDIKISIKEDW